VYSVVEIVLSVPFVYEVNDEVRKLLEDFRRLQFYIEYKAKLERLPVAYVKPKHTSSLCPICGGKLASNGYRLLKCKDCGYENDRDVIACVNLLRMRGAPLPQKAPNEIIEEERMKTYESHNGAPELAVILRCFLRKR